MASASVVVLFLGTLFNVLDLTAVVLASLFLLVAREEIGYRAVAVYLVTLVISLIIPSMIVTAIEYAIIAIYPIIKPLFDKRGTVLKWIMKVSYFALGSFLIFLATRIFMADSRLYMDILLGVGCMLVFFIYDILLHRFSMYYGFRLRNKLRIDKFFNQN